jgi:hypothetical protein
MDDDFRGAMTACTRAISGTPSTSRSALSLPMRRLAPPASINPMMSE